jgi:hypothetical protein
MVAFINTGVPCSTAELFREIPLCSARTVWEARTEASWDLEYQLYTMNAKGFNILTLGNLMDAQDSTTDPLMSQALDNWNANTDSLGVLVCAALSMVHRGVEYSLDFEI